MIVQLERLGLIRRTARQARSIELLVPADQLPALQPINTPVAKYLVEAVINHPGNDLSAIVIAFMVVESRAGT